MPRHEVIDVILHVMLLSLHCYSTYRLQILLRVRVTRLDSTLFLCKGAQPDAYGVGVGVETLAVGRGGHDGSQVLEALCGNFL